MARITAESWLRVLTICGVRAATAATWAPLFERYIQDDDFSEGRAELHHFVGQALTESANLERLVEDLSYTPQRLCEVWPARFPGSAGDYGTVTPNVMSAPALPKMTSSEQKRLMQ